MGKFFGTDGVRGVANKELTPNLAYKIARAGGHYLAKNFDNKERLAINIGKDTRLSGDMLEAALIAGFNSVGIDVNKLDIVPTPGVAYLTDKMNVIGGVMISASHNPIADNGIKFFDNNGYKLSDEVENEIEYLIYKEILPYFEVITPRSHTPVLSEDPTDDKFIHCALTKSISTIISGDRHLLDLKYYKSIAIFTPEEFLKRM